MADDIRIEAWPKEQPLRLSHGFEGQEPCPVSVGFDGPLAVQVGPGEGALDVNMAMDVSAKRPLPLCVSLCEPICAKSDYRIDIAIFDQPVANIVIRGLTRLFNCKDEPTDTPGRELCADMNRLKPEQQIPDGVELANGVKATPAAGGELRTVTFGDPAGATKLAFPTSGLRLDLPQPASQVKLQLNCYAGMALDVTILGSGTALEQRSEPFSNEVKTLVFNRNGITAVEVKGGMNEAALVEVCFTPEKSTGAKPTGEKPIG